MGYSLLGEDGEGMSSMREIRTRIKSVNNTAQITRAMQLVASSKMQRAQENAVCLRPYMNSLGEMVGTLVRRAAKIRHPYLAKRDLHVYCVLVITTDRGLCGALNQNLLKLLSEFSKDTHFVVVGHNGLQALRQTTYPVLGQFLFPDNVTSTYVDEMAAFLWNLFESKTVDAIEVLFQQFKNTMTQTPIRRPLLPLSHSTDNGGGMDAILPLVEPGVRQVADRLFPFFFKQILSQVLLEAKASEHSSRMMAMKAATDNAETLIEECRRAFNKARQAGITNEILEITSSRQSST
jgi:F-type H+-transporting ATPase subunit gamma